MEKERSHQMKVAVRLKQLKLRHISALEIKYSKRSSKKEIKDQIESTFGCAQENEENEYMSDHLFTMPFRTKDNSLQD